MYDKLQDSCTEAELSKDEANEERNKLCKAEMDLLSALERVSFVLWIHIAAWIICKVTKVTPQIINMTHLYKTSYN